IKENHALRSMAEQQSAPKPLVGSGPVMDDVRKKIELVGRSSATVLIRGESGVGKELVSRAIHQRSTRSNRPFVKVNCAALPAELLESELFGHERGAFTGAATTRIGKFEQADTGTMFMDEIGELKPALQAKLLHVLQDAEFTKLGSNKRITVDVRVVAATNRDLEKMMVSGEFREDLYYRLKVIELTVPPLRQRPDEVPTLTDFFIARYSRKYNRPARPMSDHLRRLFLEYEWPGNIRELENMIKRVVILQDEHLVVREIERNIQRVSATTAAALSVPAFAAAGSVPAGIGAGGLMPYLPPPVTPDPEPVVDDVEPGDGATGGASLAAVAKAASMKAERAAIEQTLGQVHWNRRKAAQILGVSYKTLLNKIKECGISRA
ncbi:MAG: sigma-54 dependent transcriptional regulator, partial [Verrucomicrobiota bacterium]|nr:sigma-54 dependent transcriptional regulator [Verrucomicrobiota bacterium]